MVDTLNGVLQAARFQNTNLDLRFEYRIKRRVWERIRLDEKDTGSLTATSTLQERDETTIPPPTTFTHIASTTEASDSSTSHSDVATTTTPEASSQSTVTGPGTSKVDTSSTPSQRVGGTSPTGISTSSMTSTAQVITGTQTSGASASDSKSNNKKDIPVIVATVIGAIALLSILILALVYLRRHLKRRKRWRRPSTVPSIETVSPFTLGSSTTSPLATDRLSMYMAQLPSPSQSYRSQLERKLKNEREGERIQYPARVTYPSIDHNFDHQVVGGRDIDRRNYDYDGDGIRREPGLVVASNASLLGAPPPSYQP
ncbi:hypothetical protein L218DRAFT_1006528 [Marasmius fiardii PR-910]|nr:hypothetical protein L218DRAFT_1006528 [Marasmius fiardii PR-910]